MKVLFHLIPVRQKLLIEVYHEASPPTLVGSVDVTIGEIFGSRSKGLVRDIFDSKDKIRGRMVIKCEKIEKGSNKMMDFNLKAFDLPSSSFFCFGTDEKFFKIFKIRNGVEYLLYESEVKLGKAPRFDLTSISEKRLCNNNPDQPITLKMYSTSNFFAPSIIGSLDFTVKDVENRKLMLT